ncbi:ABC transporter permease [Halioxenophilus sp. WMMB6]|uniref:ABC transporter permease n=1 Tax=Halioxenophilus sp. WMMB6 TaxID=3073815 RepID=UPI00295ED777|nr:FtsX-like permease family protein [Halioxenophilus sp. WMMB6]
MRQPWLLSVRLLWRNLRGGELTILAVSVVLAVAVVTAIAVFADRMDHSLKQQSHAYLAADRQVSSRFPMPDHWFTQANQFDLQQSRIIEFGSMVFAGEEMTLASVKAVAEGYPLRGQLEVSQIPFATAAQMQVTTAIPAPGEVWVESSLLPMMGLALGDSLWIGEQSFTIKQVLMYEPDGNRGISMTGPRVLMNIADVPATGVIQPGSRISYLWLLAGEEDNLERFKEWLEPELGEHYRWRTVEESERRLGGALNRGKSFLMLAAMIGVLLAGVAIAMASQQFARVNQDAVALFKSLGSPSGQVRFLYFGQLLCLGVLATLLGLAAGEVLHRFIAQSIGALFNVTLVGASLQPYVIGFFAGLVCLLCFALPPIWPLPNLPPIRILRSDVELAAANPWLRGGLGVLAIMVLIGVYSLDLKLTLTVMAGLFAVTLLAALLGFVLLKSSRQLGSRAGSIWRLAIANLLRNGQHSLTQLVVFATAIMLLQVLYLVRTSLIDEWRLQLPDDAPNHFILNMSANESSAIKSRFEADHYFISPLYPMVLGRLVAHNDHHYQEEDRGKSNTLRRELNLSWTAELPADNRIEAGQWWPEWQGEGYGVSVEEFTAGELGLSVGDKLQFSLGGLELSATVASIRSVDWNAMTPNFYFLFSPGALENYSPTYMTSATIPTSDKQFITELIRDYPTIVVIEVDRIIERIKSIVDQVSQGVGLVLWVVLMGGVLVLVAAVNASMQARLHETSIIRALGSSRRKLVGSLWLEFSLLGFLAGLMAVIGTESILWSLRVFVFELQGSFHWQMWIAGPLLATLFIGLLGALACRRVVVVPPALVLRELQS